MESVTAKAGASTVRQTIVTSLEAPQLEGVGTKACILFVKKRKLHERRIEEKKR